MSSTTYGWLTINDHDDLSGNGQLTIGSVNTHTGRSARSKVFTLTTDSGADATLTVGQSAAAAIFAIDGFEDSNHNDVLAIGAAGGLYYMKGHANVNFLEAYESETSYTDLNDQSTGTAWNNGFTIIEANGTSHTGIEFEATIPYGTDAQYTFKIPVVFQKTNERIEITFGLTDDVTSTMFAIIQNAE